MMAVAGDFVAAGPGVLLDPVLKLRLEQGRWSPESNAEGGSIAIHIAHDPKIERGRLTMPRDEDELRLASMIKSNPSKEKPFRSKASREIGDFDLDIDKREGVGLFVRSRTEIFSYIIRSISKIYELIPPEEILEYCLGSILLMDNWENDYSKPWGEENISIWVRDDLATILGAKPCLKTDGGFVQLATRSVKL